MAELPPVANEMGVNRFFSNVRGTLSLAHYPGETNNATCHWFINLADNAYLDAPNTNNAYTVFGRVIAGLEHLDRLNPAHVSRAIKLVNLGGRLDEAPVRLAAPAGAVTYDDLLTVTSRLVTLDMHVLLERLAANVRRLSWRSVSNRTHTVTWQPTLGGSWTTLWTTNGNGAVQSLLHTNAGSTGFYRVRYQP